MNKKYIIIGSFLFLITVGIVIAAIGDLLGTVNLPGNGNCAVAGTFDGTYYMTMRGGFAVGCAGNVLQVFQPPVGGNGSATLIANKTILDASNNPVSISALAWDAGRSKVWGAYAGNIYLIDIGVPTVSGNAVATLQFSPGFGGLIDGLAYDGSDDTLYYTPDVSCDIHHYAANGTLLNVLTPKNAAGNSDCSVSGVVVGTNNTLYIGRDGAAEIRRIDKTTGNFVSQFATTSGRVEDLTCDPVTYAPNEAILAKDAYNSLYEAFEVEPGTCPLQVACPDDDGDGVNDCDDQCLDSKEDNIQLNPNQYAQNSNFGPFEVGPNNDQSIVYDMETTNGCTCKQIVEQLGVGVGHIKKGCSPSVMEEWTGINAQPDRKAGIGRK